MIMIMRRVIPAMQMVKELEHIIYFLSFSHFDELVIFMYHVSFFKTQQFQNKFNSLSA